jgi:hypothetical protein
MKLEETRQALAEEGLRVKFHHVRRWRVKDGARLATIGHFRAVDEDPASAVRPSDVYELDPKGGHTVCELVSIETGDVVVEAVTSVHPKDVYCKKTGRIKALGAALSALAQRQHVLDEAATVA